MSLVLLFLGSVTDRQLSGYKSAQRKLACLLTSLRGKIRHLHTMGIQAAAMQGSLAAIICIAAMVIEPFRRDIWNCDKPSAHRSELSLHQGATKCNKI